MLLHFSFDSGADKFGKSEVITDLAPRREGGQGGADTSLHDLIFRGLPKDDPQ